jgi:hypothetical protein
MLNRFRSCALSLALVLGVAHAQAAEPGQPRLKFRGKGPVCSCATGMGEEEIRKAWEARFAQPEITRSESSDRLTTPGDEQRREIDESQSR